MLLRALVILGVIWATNLASSDSPSYASPSPSPLSSSRRIRRSRCPTPDKGRKHAPIPQSPPVRRKVPVYLSAIWVDPDSIAIARTVYGSLGLNEILDVPEPSEERLMNKILFLSIVGPNDDYKLYNLGTKSVMEYPETAGLLDDLLTGVTMTSTTTQRRPKYRLNWYARMQHTRHSSRIYYYTLEAEYSVHRPGSAAPSLRSSRCSSRSVSRSCSVSDLTAFVSPEGTDDEGEEDGDPHRAVFRLERVDVVVSERPLGKESK